MLIEIECTNLTDFDPATGRSGICGNRMMVDSRKIGELVTCPNCDQDVVVDTAKYRQPTKRSNQTQPPNEKSSAQKRASTSPRSTKTKPIRKSSGTAPSRKSSGKTPSRKQPDGQTRRRPRPSNATPQAPSTAVEQQLEMSAAKAEVMIAGSAGTQCRRCGGSAPFGKCVKCKAVESRFENLHRPVKSIEPRLAGIQLWFCKTLSEGFSLSTMAIGLHCLVGLATLLLLVLSILGMVGMGIGVAAGITVFIITVLLASFYAGLVFKGYQFLRTPNARVAWFQVPFWNAILMMARMQSWENYDSRLKGRHVLRVRDREFTDLQIPELDGIRKVAVLDLEGTSITDQGLALMYRLEHLRCLVVRKTNVTREGVYRLQQAFPHLWIWS